MKRIIYTLVGMMLSIGCWADTLQEQINSAADGATITLTEDVTISQTILVDKNITIDGGSHTITSSVNNKLGTFYINTGTCTLTIQNATIDGGNTASMAVVAYRGKANSGLTTVDSGDRDNNNSGNVINMTNCTVKNFTGFPNSYAGAVYVFGLSSANLTNCTFSGNTTSLQSTDGASGADVWAGAAATVNIDGGSYQEVFVNSDKTNNSSITVSNGAKVTELSVCVTENSGSTNQPSITVDNASVTNITTETGNIIPSSAVNQTNGGTVTNIPTAYVAKIGDKQYSSLISAINAATAGQTITLLSDVTISTVDELSIDKALTLDLAGHTITSTVKEPILVKNGGDLTITGSGTIAGPTGDAGKSLDGHAIITVKGGKLTYLNGTLTCGGVGSDGMYGVYILNGGTAVFGNESDKTGPTITSWFAAIGENNTTAPANITVYGGSYTAQATPSESDWWSYFCAPIYAAGSGEINISGGEFEGYYGLSSRYSNVNQDLNITGGTFKGTKSALFFDNKSGVESSETRDVAVSGGTFSSAVPEEYCADGFIPTDDGHGNYGVKEGSYVAQIGGQGYESLADAVAAATDGQTITLLANVNVDKTILIEKNITIDGDNHTISSTVTSILGTFYVNEPACTFAIENATIDGQNTASMAVCVYRGKANDTLDATPTVDTENSGNNVTLTDCTVQNFTGWPGSYVGAVYAYSKSHLTLNNCTFTGNTTTLSTNGASGADVWTGAATTVVINGGTYNEVFVNTNSSNTETVTIEGGAEIEELAICVSYKENGSTNIPVLTIDNATVTNLTTEERNPIPENGITIQNEGSITNKPAYEAAKILNGTKTNAFASLDDAIEAAKAEQTITLLKDAIATKELPANVTIDADGKALTLPTFKVSDGTALTYAKVIHATDDTYKVTTATYNRTGAVGTQWGTVCLPFSIESAPTGYTLYTPSAVSKTELTVTEVSYPVAIGTPVIFYKNTTDEAVITSTDASVKINATPLAQSGTLALVGTFSNQKIESGLENIYYINGDHFHQAQASLTVPAYRAYINYTASGAKPRVLSLLVGDADATAIEAVSSSISAATAIYDASGRKLSAPQKGLNIIKLADGKTVKLLIK